MRRNVEGEGGPETAGPKRPARDGYGDGGSPFKPPSRRPVLHRLLPVSQQLPAYRGGTLRRDLLAGLTVAALVATALVPLAAGDPERYGSLAALLALLVGPATCSPGRSAWAGWPTTSPGRC